MNKRTKLWLLIGTTLMLVGALMIVGVMIYCDWDVTKLNHEIHTTKTYEVGESFEDIFIHITTAHVTILPSEDDSCKVVCKGSEHIVYSVEVIDQSLSVTANDQKPWQDRLFHFGEDRITIYLPERDYASVVVKGITGDVDIEGISMGRGAFSVTTGDISLEDVMCKKDLEILATTGKMNLQNVSCESLVAKGTTGKVSMEHVVTQEKLSVERTTGDVTFHKCDAGELWIEVGTGDVFGSLLEPMTVIAKATTGDVHVPDATFGGMCHITTTTGDITVTIE